MRLVGGGLILIGAVSAWDALVSRGHGHILGGPRLEAIEGQSRNGQIRAPRVIRSATTAPQIGPSWKP